MVVSGRYGALETWWHSYSDEDWAEADRLLDEVGFSAIAYRPFGVISEGERQHVLLACALISRPELLLLDEPAAGLDLGRGIAWCRDWERWPPSPRVLRWSSSRITARRYRAGLPTPASYARENWWRRVHWPM